MHSTFAGQEQLGQEQAEFCAEQAASQADLAKQQTVVDKRVVECVEAEAQLHEGQFLLCAI